MRRLTFLFFGLIALLNTVTAKNIYLSQTGSDNNDGLSLITPVATLSNAYLKATAGDIICVTGIIDFSTDPALTTTPKAGLAIDKQIRIEGTTATTDGFDGKQSTRFFQLNEGAELTLKNLLIKNGSYNAALGGGAMYINGGKLACENVIFDSNSVNYSSTATGGVFRVDATTGLCFMNCTFSQNSGNSAGVLYVNDTKNSNVNITFNSCLFISNISNGNNGGTVSYFRLANSADNNNISFINCTMTKNQVTAQSNGGMLYFTRSNANVTSNIINCTIYDNTAAGFTNHGAGIKVLTAYYGKLNIYNSVVEGNMTLQNKVYSDLVYSFAPTTSNLSIKNSIVGRSGGTTTIPSECYSGDNYFNYLIDRSIKLDLIAFFANFDETKKIYPILPGSAAINLGDTQYLKALNINVDQAGTVRPFTNNKCHAGAAEIIGAITNPDGSPAENYKHFIMYGQSLSTGHQAYPVISTENITGNYMIGDQIWINYGNSNPTEFNPLVGTISNAFKNQQGIMSRNSGTIAECPLFGAVNHIQMKQPGQKILATSAGTSGMTIEQLSKESQTKTLYNDYVSSVKYAAAIARNSNIVMSCPAIFWLQGEWNYQGYEEGLTLGSKPTSDKNEYKALMLNLKNNMQSEAQFRYGQEEKPLFITYECGAQYIKGREQTIGMAELEASNENEDIVCAGSIYPMTDRGGHLDPNGYRWYGEMLGKVYYQTKVLGEKFKPLQPMEISRTELNNKIKIKFLVKHLPLVLDQSILPKMQDYGFEIYVNNVRLTITNVSLDNDCVYITTSGSMAGNLEVVYAGEHTGGSGNLRDSDPYQAYFNYIDLDKKNPDNSYVFPRDANEITLRPSYEPKDATGAVIYDQSYPLYNFSVSFYYKVSTDQQVYTVPNIDNVSGTKSTISSKGITAFQSGKNLTIETDVQDMETFNVRIFSTSGLLVNSFCLLAGNGKNRKEYSLCDLQSGIYLANIESETRAKTVKLVVN